LTLTDEQRQAVESWRRGDVCVVAGPGSGKTRVLVERFKWLVQEKQVPIRRILAITFTDKAAANMRLRLVEAFPPGSDQRKAIERAYISTIHAFCARLLRENAIQVAVDPEFRVLDEWEAGFELRLAIAETLEREYAAHPERVRDFLPRFGSSDVHGSLFRLYQAVRAAGATMEEAAATAVDSPASGRWRDLLDAYDQVASFPTADWNARQRQALEEALALRSRLAALPAAPLSAEHRRALEGITYHLGAFKMSPQRDLLKKIRDEMAPACRACLLFEEHAGRRSWLLEMLSQAGERYRERKRQSSALDYEDLEELAIRLLEKTRGRAADFDFILMDEFQDTNPLQARLTGLLRSGNCFFAVGDINQSIYGFRHADPEVFRQYRTETEQSGGEVISLFQNFRSRPEILKAIQAIIRGAEGLEEQELEAGKPFRPAKAPCVEILTVQAEDGDTALKLEASHVAARIQQLCGTLELESGPARYGDFAILFRTTAQIRIFERVLRKWGIPCQVSEGRGFYEQQEITDLVHFLRLLLNPLNEISLAAVLRSPLAGISDETLLRLKLASASLIEGMRRASGLAPDEDQRLVRFRELLDRYRRSRDDIPPDRLLGRLLSDTGYEAFLLQQPGGALRAANVRKLLALARRFRSSGPAGLQGFLDRVEDLRREEIRESEAEPPEQSGDAVKLMTVHAAKGLEFPVVFVPAVNRRTRSDYEPVAFYPQIGVGIHWKDPDAAEPEPDAIAEKIAGARRKNNREETQRLFYVAMTRAKELLGLSASFGSHVKSEQWVKGLVENFEIELARADNRVRVVEIKGVPVRLLQTNEEPPALPAAAPEAEKPAALWCERASPGDQADTAVSASAVTLFSLCPRKYYLSRYLGFDPAGRSRLAAMSGEQDAAAAERDEMDSTGFGQHVHALLAGLAPRNGGDPEALRLAANFESSDLGRRAARASRIEREQAFVILTGERLVRGQIDLWFEEGGETIVVDYKTDDVSAGAARARAAEYELQLRLYALAVQRIAGVLPDRAVVYFLRPNMAVDIALDPPALAAAQWKVEELFQAQSRIDFPLRAGEHCFHCPHFRGICPARYPAAAAPTSSAAAVR
jgi:ATP-dependent helicase/nuclease subunit A